MKQTLTILSNVTADGSMEVDLKNFVPADDLNYVVTEEALSHEKKASIRKAQYIM